MDITRELIQDDDGNEVLRLFNPLLGGVRYLVTDPGTVSTKNLAFSSRRFDNTLKTLILLYHLL